MSNKLSVRKIHLTDLHSPKQDFSMLHQRQEKKRKEKQHIYLRISRHGVVCGNKHEINKHVEILDVCIVGKYSDMSLMKKNFTVLKRKKNSLF